MCVAGKNTGAMRDWAMSTKVDTSRFRWRATSISGLAASSGDTIRNSCWAILLVIVFRDAPIGKIPATHFRLGQIGSLGCQLGLLITSPSRLRCLRSLVFPNLACLASAFDARKPTDPLVATPGEPYPGAPTPAGLGRAPTTW